MNNFIIISKTFAEITPESCEESDFSDSGFITEYEEVSFSELVELMEEHSFSSCSPMQYNTREWYSTEFYVSDYYTGTSREESIHFHKDNTLNAAKYWKYARIAANKNIQKRNERLFA